MGSKPGREIGRTTGSSPGPWREIQGATIPRGSSARPTSQLQFQRDGSTLQALLVGQSGPHHFSAVFAFDEIPDRDVPGRPLAEGSPRLLIRVDVADRSRGPVESLGATYTVDARSDDLVDAGPTVAAWGFGPDRLTFAAVGPAHVSLAEAGRRATRIQALAGTLEGASTRRFVYSWQWEPDLRR